MNTFSALSPRLPAAAAVEQLGARLRLPPIIFGTSCLGNLYEEVTAENKMAIVSNIIEAVGLPATFRAAVEEVCFAGRVVYIGYATAQNFADVITVLESGRYPVEETITRTVAFAEAGAALAAWAANPSIVTKLHVTM